MITEFIFLLLKDNYKIFAILNVFRDVFLLLVLIFSFGSIVIRFLHYKKLDSIYLGELILVIIFVFLLTEILNYFLPSIRPISYFSIIEEQRLDSFPSQHTAISFAISFITIISNLQLGFMLFILSIWIALLSWLSLMHWPIDIIFGIIISLISTSFSWWLIQSFLRFYVKKIKA